MSNKDDRITDFLKEGSMTYYLDEGRKKVYVNNFEIGDTRVDPNNGNTEKYTESGWIKYDIEAELARSLVSEGETRR